MLGDDVRQLLDDYPKVFFACHARHVRDPDRKKLVSTHQASILDHLDELEPTTLTDLARHMGVTASTMSIGVERLVKAGYVRRQRDPRDRRRVRLRLTTSGSRVRSAHSVLEPERVRAMLIRLSARQRAEALRGLRLLAQAATQELPDKRLRGLRSDAKRRLPTR